MDVVALLPAYLRERPNDPVELAHWLLAAETGPLGHLPCPEISGCVECARVLEERMRPSWADTPADLYVNPAATEAARELVAFWFSMGSSRIDIRFGLPKFDPLLVPRA